MKGTTSAHPPASFHTPATTSKRQRSKIDDMAVLMVDKVDGFAEESTSQEILQKIDQALVTLTDRFAYLDDRDDMVLEHLIMVHSEMAVGMG